MLKASRFLSIIVLFFFAVIMESCGGGGGGTSTSGGGGTSTSISGVASDGPISGGTVKVYALDASGNEGSLLGSSTTGEDGRYSVNLGTYTGNVLVEVTGGTYTDEATGSTVSLGDMPLRAALTGVSGDVTVSVTPLTEIAVRYAGQLTKDNIEKGNAVVKSLFNLDIIGTIPADVTSGTYAKSQEEVEYGLMLASISQMVKDRNATNVTSVFDAIEEIKNDLTDNGKVDVTGHDLIITELTNFIKNPKNKSGVRDLAQTGLDESIGYHTDHTVAPSDMNIDDLWKAKALVTDLRNTALSIHNYDTDRFAVVGVIDTPFKDLMDEFDGTIKPELTKTLERIGWIIGAADNIPSGESGTYTFTDPDSFPGLTLDITSEITSDITSTPPNEREISFTIKNTSNETVDSGSLTISYDNNSMVTGGSFNASMQTATGTLTANMNYTGTLDSEGYYDTMTFTGSMTAPGVSYDFSQDGRKLYATFDPRPGATKGYHVYPTSITYSGRITSETVQMDGSWSISPILWKTSEGVCKAGPMPKSVIFEGSFKEIKDGSPTGVIFTGKITGNWENADTYNSCIGESDTNFIKAKATFDGRIEGPDRPTITAFLGVERVEFKKYNLDASYRKTNKDGTIRFLTGSGTYDDDDGKIKANLSNQVGMKVEFTYNRDSKDLTGAIKTSGEAQMATIYKLNGVPTVKYSDGYLESIF